MKYFIPMIILSLVLLSCSKEDEKTDTTTVLEGTWKSACYTDSDNNSFYATPTFAGNVLTITNERHSDTSCATDYSLEKYSFTFSIGDAVTFSNGKTGHKFTVTLGSTFKITPQSASAVSDFDSSRKCDKIDWAEDTEKECSVDEDDVGDTILCLYQLDGNNFYPDCNDS